MPRWLRIATMLLVTLGLTFSATLPSYASWWRSAFSDSEAALASGTTWVAVGSFQDDVSSCGEWTNTCDDTTMEDDNADGVYRFVTDTLPAGSYEYKVVEYDNWDNAHPAENVGLAADGSEVRLYFQPGPNNVADNVNQCIATVAGSFQSELGGTGANWAPDNLVSMMWQDPSDSDWYQFTATIPAGDWEYKVARDEDWAESYPADDNVALSLSEDTEITFRYNCVTNEVMHEEATTLLDWVVAGNFQDEVSACGEWNNACAETMMEDDNADGVYRFVTTTLPANNYEYKVVEFGNWDNAHPAENVVLAADGSEMRWYFQPGANHVADNMNQCIATVAGSFQSELGGTGTDWTPANLVSMMWQDAPGSDWYEFTATIPAGDWEYKVARDEDWAESYPADDNVALSLAEDGVVTFRYNCDTNEVLHEISSDGDLIAPMLDHPFSDEILYFLIPDRFNNGSDANNCGAEAFPCGDTQEDVLRHGYLPNDRGYYHGGDLQGVIDKLDYIEDMGVTAIWVGPIFANKPVQEDSSNLYGHSSGYHGYWITDFMNVDPHLGTNEEFQTLVDEAHARGIQVFMDIITNHTADIIRYAEEEYSYRNKTDFPFLDTDGNAFDDLEYAFYGQDDYSFPAMDINGFPYTPNVPAGELEKNPAWLNDLTLYHNRGNTSFFGENSIYGDFFGLDDLFTARREVAEGMLDIYAHWIETYGVDGFRIDTTKHVNMEFWQFFGPEIQAVAEAQDLDHFFAFGEVYDQQYGPSFMSEFSTKGELQSTIDFAFQLEARAFASQSDASNRLEDFFADDDYYTDWNSNAYAMPTFIGNHDMGRIGYFLKEDNPGASDDELLSRTKLAHAMMYFMRGSPVIYYGDEQGFVGDGGDKLARQDMFPSLVPEYNDDDLIGTDATTADDNFDQSHPIYQALVTYSDVYSDHVALRRGAHVSRHSTDGAGVYAFSRIDRDEQVEYVIAFNNAESSQNVTFSTYLASTDYEAVHPTGNPNVTTDGDGNITLDVPALDFVIYRATSALPASAGAPNISIANLVNDQEVPLAVDEQDGHQVRERIEVEASLDANTYAEVTFVVRPSNVPTYTLVGVDNSPPYRVFYDASWLMDESGRAMGDVTLEFKAIVSDLNGNWNSAGVTGILGVDASPPGTTYQYAVIHYYRPDGDYGDHTTGDFNDFWGLHLWGDAIDPSEATDWENPKPFLGEDEYGRFAWIKLADASKDVNFIIHRGNTKDGTEDDRAFNPVSESPEIWTQQDDGAHYLTQADAQGYITIRYHRPADDYGDYDSDDYEDFWGLHLWNANGDLTGWTTPKKADGQDDYGVYFTLPLTEYPGVLDFSIPLNFIVHKGDVKDPPESPDRSFAPSENATIWLQQDDLDVHTSQGSANGVATIHYHRPDGDYGDPTSSDFNDFWGMHVWTGAADPNPGWTQPLTPTGQDIFGIYFEVDLVEDADQLAYILHRGDEKDPGPDQFLTFNTYGYDVWQPQGADPEDPYILPILAGGASCTGGSLAEATAHWLTVDTIAWEPCGTSDSYALYHAPDGGMELTEAGLTGGTALDLTLDPAGLSDELKAKWPHLADYMAFKLSADDLDMVPDLLKGQLALASMDADSNPADTTRLQIPGVLDDLYVEAAYDETLGISYSGDAPTLSVWAPTAKSVALHLFASPTTESSGGPIAMTLDESTGIWSITGDASWTGMYYLYDVEVYVPSTAAVEHNMVTDPYAVSLSMNSTHSQIVDLSDASLKPAGWDTLEKPPLGAPEEVAVYELHVRDFSVNDDSVPEEEKGQFTAFTLADSNGMQHLSDLAEAGMTHLHLLPVFDIATIEEDPALRQEVDWDELAGYDPDSEEQQAAVDAIRDQDAFNWGYDPFHYTVPEGSYSSDPNSTARIIEFREMVQALNESGLRVVMDVVYNHTNSSGQDDKSVLDKVVPGYYHRLDQDGNVTTSTCCQNTATEHAMMEKLMVDSLVTWATAYKVDGFRFDLMGHHMVSNMIAVSDTLHSLTMDDDGVDGEKIYIYGEGWNFGEVADGARGTNATQLNVGGLGIGTFNDRLRDAARGGGPFDGGESLKLQGFINGLYYDPNDFDQGTPEDQLAKLLLSQDQIRVGLAANLAGYEFIDRNGNLVTGAEVDYNGAPAGYTEDPQEHIIYVSAHDNQTLFDVIQYKAPVERTTAERARMQNLGLSLSCLSQGVTFFHAGSDTLRSKSLDRNSYNSSDWFNKLDFTYQDNNWGVGLPPAEDNASDWTVMQPLLANPALSVSPDDILSNVMFAQECLAITRSSPLFNLHTAEEVQQMLQFHNTGTDQTPGLIVMSLSESGTLTAGDPETIVILFNANDEAQDFTVAELAGAHMTLHEIQANSHDAIVRSSSFDGTTGTFSVPARTTAVFINSIYGVMVAPEDLAQSGDAGTSVTYSVEISNTGNTQDTFAVTINGATWLTTPSDTSITLGLGESATLDVTVAIPTDAPDGDIDSATVTLTSEGDNTQTASATLTTTAINDPTSITMSGMESTSNTQMAPWLLLGLVAIGFVWLAMRRRES